MGQFETFHNCLIIPSSVTVVALRHSKPDAQAANTVQSSSCGGAQKFLGRKNNLKCIYFLALQTKFEDWLHKL